MARGIPAAPTESLPPVPSFPSPKVQMFLGLGLWRYPRKLPPHQPPRLGAGHSLSPNPSSTEHANTILHPQGMVPSPEAQRSSQMQRNYVFKIGRLQDTKVKAALFSSAGSAGLREPSEIPCFLPMATHPPHHHSHHTHGAMFPSHVAPDFPSLPQPLSRELPAMAG